MHSALPPVPLERAPAGAPTPAGALRWKQADHDVHVATLHGEYAGFVAGSGGEYALHGPQGQPMGVFAALRDARAALQARLAPPAAPPAPRHARPAAARRRAHGRPRTRTRR